MILRRLSHAYVITLQISVGEHTDSRNVGGENLDSRQTAEDTKPKTFLSWSTVPTVGVKRRRNPIKKDFLSTAPEKSSLQGVFQKEYFFFLSASKFKRFHFSAHMS